MYRNKLKLNLLMEFEVKWYDQNRPMAT